MQMTRWTFIALLFAAMLTPTLARATVAGGNVGVVTQLWPYTDYGTGDVALAVSNPFAGCSSGFWIRMTDAGAKQVFSLLLAAQLTQTTVSIYAYTDQLWSGSTGQMCRIYTATMVQ